MPVGTSGAAAPSLVLGILGGGDRRGRWRVPERMTVVNVLGGADLDLREATLAAPEVEIRVFSLLGGSDVIVPEGVHVELGGFALLGGNDLKLDGAGAAARARPSCACGRGRCWVGPTSRRRPPAPPPRPPGAAGAAPIALNGGLRGQEPAARGRSRPRCRPLAAPPAAPGPPGGTLRPGGGCAAGRACSRGARPRSAGIASPASRSCSSCSCSSTSTPGPAHSYWDTVHQAKQRRSEVAELKRENAKLRARREALRGPSALEREARRLGMVRPGERPYVLQHLPKGP